MDFNLVKAEVVLPYLCDVSVKLGGQSPDG